MLMLMCSERLRSGGRDIDVVVEHAVRRMQAATPEMHAGVRVCAVFSAGPTAEVR